MTKINLLPWREERRQELKRQFFVILFGVALIGAGCVYLVEMTVQNQIENQRNRNEFIISETKKLDEKIKEIEELKKKRERLVERMNVIQDLQGNRPVIVHVFDQLAKTIPDGVFYRTIQASGDNFTIEGLAEANNRVSNLMRNLSASPMFAEPNLSTVQVEQRNGEDWSRFRLTVKRENQTDKKGKGEG
ncbi:MAG: PilN domain-containing protein [Ketobacteraceae bacterium]|nr:PilN domain-containing protein [Ketobacteraceae bacterium]